MAHELTEVEIAKIKEEIADRQQNITPKCIAEVQRTRALGDLSENDEYRSAKRELNRNYSRIRYLKALLDAHIANDKCHLAKNPNKKAGAAPKKKKYQDFGNARMDHVFRADEEAARIPAGYKIDLRRFEDEVLDK